MMRRHRAVLVVMAVLAGACAGDDTAGSSSSVTSTSTSALATTTSTTQAPTTTTTEADTTGISLAVGVDTALTVANPEGAFLVDGDFAFQLIEGPVELAIADGSGGLVFQRSSDNFLLDPTATIISYLPADSFQPRELLVPTGEQYLYLRDVQDGAVWYTRREGDNPDTARETLRTYDLGSKTVDEFAVTGGWESGSIEVSVGGPNVVAFWSAEAATGFTFYAESGGQVGVDGDPYDTGFCGDGTGVYNTTTGDKVGAPCYEYAELSHDGRLAYYERAFDGAQVRFVLVVVDLDSGEELFRQDLDRPDQGWVPKGMDLRGDQIIVNRTETGVRDAPYTDAFIIDLTSGSVVKIGLAGQARFLIGQMKIS